MNSYKMTREYRYWVNRKPKTSTYELTIFEDGTIKQGNTELSHICQIGDCDTDRIVNILPHVYVTRKHTGKASFTVDELMATAGFVSGDKSQFMMPRVYHKDWDRLNCKSDNLEWIDERDPKFIDYMNSWKTK